ncbi:hypothetical protein [Pusillimonas sp. NJUB218]|uniref:hypothetical protein n=1 Tax=Pusillimonas sp. NJUB218 TaxID=2023230 RepID=UPI000F4B96B5|nr:hypothetical protein [Pusillimonas sp. NJUB218]ROT46378.1 hypothetical protein CHR62_00085 [Pusillimonas sp. NJUB218]
MKSRIMTRGALAEYGARKSWASVWLVPLVLALSACVGPITDDDNTPAGTVETITDAAKRPATAAEQQAVLKALSSVPGAVSVQVDALQVQDSIGPVRAFCARASGLGERAQVKAPTGLLSGLNQPTTPPANVSGMLKTVDGKDFAFDFRFGTFAAQRCEAMGF